MKALMKPHLFKLPNHLCPAPVFPGFCFYFTVMELPIFFIDSPATANMLTLNEETSRHIVQVLRMKPAERLQLTDGTGNLLTAEIADDHKKKCTVTIVKKQVIARKQQEVSVAISVLKNASRFEWFLEKATEIGVTEIIPLLCSRTEKQHFRYDRMKQIVISAMMQSRQVWLPFLHQPKLVSDIICHSDYRIKLIAHCGEETKAALTDFRSHPSVQILIGPEGDFTKEEICLALANNFHTVSLGENRLRTETAGVAAATILCI